MADLRWALIGVSVLFLAGLALWEWRKSRRRRFTHAYMEPSIASEPVERARRPDHVVGRLEPSMDGMTAAPEHEGMDLDVPTIHPVESLRVALSADAAVDVPSAARLRSSGDEPQPAPAPIQWPPRETSRVLSLRVVDPHGAMLPGRELRIALEAAGMRFGPQKIFHLATAEGVVLASAANLLQPGSFEPEVMDAQQFRGLNVFTVLPGVLPAERMLEQLVDLARALADRLDATVQDSDRQELDGERLARLQQSLVDQTP